MSDTTNDIPLDPGSTDPNQILPDPNDTNQTTDSNTTDPNLTNPQDPNAGTTDPNGGIPTDPTLDPNGADAGNGGSVDPNAGVPSLPQTTAPVDGLPDAVPNAASGQLPTATPSGIAGNDTSGTNGTRLGLDDKSAENKAIIIASGVSGAVGLILVIVVILLVYRRRNRGRVGPIPNVSRVTARPQPKQDRPTSDVTWIGTRFAGGNSKSFEAGDLEGGNRKSEAASIDSEATLADLTVARAKAFGTHTHSPRPSVDKLRMANMPLVPEDPFEAPRLSMEGRPHPSVEQAFPVPKVPSLPLGPRRSIASRRSITSHMRIESNSTYATVVEVEQGYEKDSPSPRSPEIPLVTPIEPPADWRRRMMELEDIPLPGARRDSMASLSRQSSRASSRNDMDVTSPSKKSVFSTIAKKRRSRADSIDPFRKSGSSLASRRKSRAESIASRNHSYSAGGVVRRKSRADSTAPPKSPRSPGARRKSRANSVRRAQSANPIADPALNMYSSSPAQRIVPAVQGLPRTPRTPTAARESRAINGQSGLRTPRTSVPPAPIPYTPRTPRTSGPLPPIPYTPRSSGASYAPPPRTPMTAPIRESRAPDTAAPRTPTTARTARTPSARARMPRAPVPRTPTSLDDAHWESLPLPPVPMTATAAGHVPVPSRVATPTPVPKPLRSAPLSSGKAELRLSQLSRALSEVSRDSPI